MRTILIFLLLSLAATEDSTAKISFSSALLTRMANLLVPLANKEAAELEIPEYTDKIKGIRVFVFDITKDIRVKPEAFRFTFTAPNLITISLNEVYCHVEALVQLRKAFIRETDKCVIDINSFNFQTTLAIGRKIAEDGVNYVPSIEVRETVLDYGIGINIHGRGISKIIGLFKDKVNESVRKSIDRLVKKSLSKLMVSINNDKIPKILPVLEIKPNLHSKVSVDTEPKMVQDGIFSFGATVSFFNDKEVSTPASKISESPDFDPESNEIQLFLGEDSVNSAAEAFLNVYPVGVWLSTEKLGNSPIRLNTSFLSGIFRGLESKFGYKEIKLYVKLTKAPKIKQFTAELEINASVDIEFFVVGGAEDGSDVSFGNVQTELKFRLAGELIKGVGSAEIKECQFGEFQSQSEFEVNLNMLENLLGMVTTFGPVFVNNQILKEVNIPSINTSDFDFIEPTVKFGNGFVHIGVTPLIKSKQINQ